MMAAKHIMKYGLIGLASICLLQACSDKTATESSGKTEATQSASQVETQVEKTADGVVLTLAQGAVKKVRLQVMSDKIIRVTALPGENFGVLPQSIQVVAKPGATQFTVDQQADKVLVKTSQVTAEVALASGQVTFFDAKGKQLLKEETRGNFAPVTADPIKPAADSFALRQEFNRGTDEGFFGLGQQNNDEVNLAGRNVELTTHNLVISIPFLVSSNNYGLFWDNNSVTRFGDAREAQGLNANLKLYDAEGKEGGLTVRYYDGDILKLTRVETDVDYQYYKDNSNREKPFPAELADAEKKQSLRVEIEGSIEAKTDGTHHFRMYSSGYAQLFMGGEKVLDRWRMNWNPWFHNYNTALKTGEKKAIKVSWKVDGGFFRLVHLDPIPAAQQGLSLFSETGKAIDYYFVAGENKDEVIAGYRQLTGKAIMLPKWVYGFWQSRERYKSSDEIVNTFKEYRDRKIPIDNIVLDWSYWPVDAWGSHDFDPKFFPDPKALTDKIHAMNGNIMISVWPKFYPTTENYKELNAKGYMFNKNLDEKNLDWIWPGYANAFYDPYPKESQAIFWKQVSTKINSKGFDAYWLDASEPDIHSNLNFTKRKELMSREGGIGSGAEYFNSYAIPHASGVHEGSQNEKPELRQFILTRSGFGGIQRTGSAIWSGDTAANWENMRDQIASGVNTGLAGMPNWTFDIGGFTTENKYNKGPKGEAYTWEQMNPAYLAEWQEQNLRWWQFGGFVPLFRSHGQYPFREIFSLAGKGTEVYKGLEDTIKLRYRLMPYIYTLAADTYHKDSTIMRGLVMDFPSDKKAWDVNTQYMFGPAFLVNPVTSFKARNREVYLPEGAGWYNFWTGESLKGGQTVTANAPLTHLPVFVRAGSIVPTGPAIQFTDEGLNAPITLNVYTGANGSFELYEDDGRSNNYLKGQFSRIPVSYDEASGILSIGTRTGEFTGMAKDRKISVRWISGASKDAANFDAAPAASLDYSGVAVQVKRAN
jgi:alpha-D-xyloside xylohydrolase